MLIKKVKLRNYRQYIDETIEFPLPSGKKNVVVIIGKNGSGKTNLLMNSIAWCLYGTEPYLNKISKALPLVNTVALEKTPNECPVEVEITLLDDEGKKIIFKRSTAFRKENEKPEEILYRHRFELWQEINGDMKLFRDEYMAKRILPQSLVGYFLFDGERLENYFKERTGEQIKNELFKLAQLNLLEDTVNHLRYFQNKFVKKSKKLTPNIENIQQNIDTLEKSLANYREELNKLIDTRSLRHQELNEVAEKLRNMPNVKELQKKREELQKTCSELEETIKSKRKVLEDYLLRAYTYVLAMPAINYTMDEINKRQEEGKIPPSIDPRFVEKLLKEGRCICGSDISKKNASCRKRVEELLTKISKVSFISSELLELKSHLTSITKDFEDFEEKVKKMEMEINQLIEKHREHSVELKKTKDQLDERLEEKYRELNERYEKLQELISKLDEDIGRHKARIEMAEKELNHLKREREKEIQKSRELDDLRKVISFCDKTIELATKVKEEILTQTRERINQLTKEIFLKLIWKKGEYSDVRIDDDYEISVVHRSGLEGLGSLSRGEMECLALSFTNALCKYSGFNFPIIMDTPLGRISEEEREKICKIFSEYLTDRQIILLLTDAEYAPNVKKALADGLLEEYWIEFHESGIGARARVVKSGSGK